MEISVPAILVTLLCLPLLAIVFYIHFGPLKKIKAAIEELEQKTLEAMDHTVATTVPVQLAKEINSCALEEAIIMVK